MSDKLEPGTPEYYVWALADDYGWNYGSGFSIEDPEQAHIEAEKRIAKALAQGGQKLDLRGLDITHLPKQISKLDNLTVLLINRSWDCKHTFAISQNELSHFKGLIYLTLDNCNLTEMIFVSTLVELRYLELNSNQITTIQGLDNLTALESLELLNNQITTIQGLDQLTALKKLSLSFNQITTIQGLDKLIALQNLDLSGNQITSIQALDKLTALKNLGLSHFVIDSFDLTQITSLDLKELILHQSSIGNIPTAILSENHFDNCLSRIKDYFEALNKDDKAINEITLMVLGNGQIGKTQLCRRLCGDDYDPTEPSTHGVLIKKAELPINSGENIKLNIWDFGGQELYHGTHRLFFNSRNTVFLLLWLPEAENTETHTVDGMTFKNHQLEYWFEHIRQCAGKDAKVIVAQAQCDELEGYTNTLPVAADWDKDFAFARMVATSARNDDGLEVLLPVLRQAAKANLKGLERQRMPKAWLRVKDQLEQWLVEDNQRPDNEKQHRLITQEQFAGLCRTADDPHLIVPEKFIDTLLHLLHHSGVIYYQKGLFENQILLDQTWCLNAIYGVFHRDTAHRKIMQNYGVFRAEDMGHWLWNDEGHSKEDQNRFIQMMLSCGVCFKISPYYHTNEDTEYCVPELLPEQTDSYVTGAIERNWLGLAAPEIEQSFDVDLLHQALFNRIMGLIAEQANEGAIYWKDGLLAYATKYKSWLMFERKMERDWQGKLVLKVRGGHSKALLQRVVEWIEHEQHGWNVKLTQCAEKPMPKPECEHSEKEKPQPAPEFSKQQPEVCVSYKWNNKNNPEEDSETVVNEFCDHATSQGIKVVRDTLELNLGDRLSSFMSRIGRGKRIIVVLSDGYLKSPNCMFELFEIWRNSKADGDKFIKRIKVYRMEGLSIDRPANRIAYAAHWKKQHQELEALIKEHGSDVLGAEDFKEFKRIQQFYTQIGDMLKHISDTLFPTKIEDLLAFGLDGLELSPEDDDSTNL